MSLTKTYSPDFERLYKAWPTYPKGRTKKHLAFNAFEKARKDFDLTSKDVDDLILLVERMKKDRKSWQRGNQYGPQGLQVWLNQRGWLDEYETIKRVAVPRETKQAETPEERARKLAEQNARFEQARKQAELRREMQRLGLH